MCKSLHLQTMNVSDDDRFHLAITTMQTFGFVRNNDAFIECTWEVQHDALWDNLDHALLIVKLRRLGIPE
mgnify:CR=1 FL=1